MSFTLDAYRRLSDPIAHEGPWALTGNPNKPFHVGRQGQKILVIGVHITAGIDDFTPPDTSAESTVSWGKTTTGASWHVCIDSDSIIPCLPDNYVAWVQGVSGYSFNKPGLGIEIGAKSTDWNSKPTAWVDKTLRNVAAWVAPRIIKYGIPIRHETNRDAAAKLISAGKPVGFMSHWTIDPNNRNDPGRYKGVDTFPWAKFLRFVQEEVDYRKSNPQKEPTMLTATLRRGDTGAQVSLLQEMLNAIRGAKLTVDGSFGVNTEAAVVAAAKAWGIAPPLEVVGPGFRTKINSLWEARNKPVPAPAPTPAPAPAPTPVDDLPLTQEEYRRIVTGPEGAVFKNFRADDPDTAPRIPLGAAVENPTILLRDLIKRLEDKGVI